MAELSIAHAAALVVLVVTATAATWLARVHAGSWEVQAPRVLALVVLAAWAG